MIHMKCQDLFSKKKKNLKVSSAAVLKGALRVKFVIQWSHSKWYAIMMFWKTEPRLF